MPSQVSHDPVYRRLKYVRDADDFLLGFVGPKREAEAIKASLGAFLRDHLKLELSPDKTLITHAAIERARFLGYEITTEAKPDSRSVSASRSDVWIAAHPEHFLTDRRDEAEAAAIARRRRRQRRRAKAPELSRSP